MRLEKHKKILIDLLKDIRKEPSPSAIGFIYSSALVHMFNIVFHKNIEPGRIIKHTDFKSKSKIEKIKKLLPEFEEKNELFNLWKNFEDKRNDLCYGYPDQEDIKDYAKKYVKLKQILETIFGNEFDLTNLNGDFDE